MVSAMKETMEALGYRSAEVESISGREIRKSLMEMAFDQREVIFKGRLERSQRQIWGKLCQFCIAVHCLK